MTTQRVTASYQEIIDLHTESDRVSILGFHTPCNDEPTKLLRPFWTAYQKVKYLGMSVSLVPAARLPADPSQVSYGAGAAPIDPRDLLNPILFHGCHGNDMGSILNQFYSGEAGTNTDITRLFSDSMDHNLVNTSYPGDNLLYEDLYYRALTDNTWLKAHPQRGFRKRMRPMVYNVAVNTPLNSVAGGSRNGTVPNSSTEYGIDDGDRGVRTTNVLGPNTGNNNYFLDTGMPGLQRSTVGTTVEFTNPATFTGQHWMTPGIRPLGWIDTRQPTIGAGYSTYVPTEQVMDEDLVASTLMTGYTVNDQKLCFIPKVFMGICMLPPAYKQEQYFRIVLNHHFAFAKYRGYSMNNLGASMLDVGNVVDMNAAEKPETKGDDDGFDDKGILYD